SQRAEDFLSAHERVHVGRIEPERPANLDRAQFVGTDKSFDSLRRHLEASGYVTNGEQVFRHHALRKQKDPERSVPARGPLYGMSPCYEEGYLGPDSKSNFSRRVTPG